MRYKIVYVVNYSPSTGSIHGTSGFDWYHTRADALAAFVGGTALNAVGPGFNWTLCEIPVLDSLSSDEIDNFLDDNYQLIETQLDENYNPEYADERYNKSKTNRSLCQ